MHQEGTELPTIFSMCVDFLFQPQNLNAEGIFRHTGLAFTDCRQSQDYAQLQNFLRQPGEGRFRRNNGKSRRRWFLPLNCTGLLKTWLRELNPPLIPVDLNAEIANLFSSTDVRPKTRIVLSEVFRVVHCLPPLNFAVLKRLSFLFKGPPSLTARNCRTFC